MNILEEIAIFVTTALKNGSTVTLNDCEIVDFVSRWVNILNDNQTICFAIRYKNEKVFHVTTALKLKNGSTVTLNGREIVDFVSRWVRILNSNQTICFSIRYKNETVFHVIDVDMQTIYRSVDTIRILPLSDPSPNRIFPEVEGLTFRVINPKFDISIDCSSQ